MPHIDLIVDGKKIPSVTEILGDKPKPWLDKWREKWGVLAERKTRIATAVGTAFHDYAEALVLDKVVVIPSNRRMAGMLMSFDAWLASSKLKVSTTELHVISKLHGFQGTFDAIGYLADKPKALCLFDWKTSSGIYPEMALQLVAYAQAYFEETGIWVKRGFIVHVSKDKRGQHKLTVKEYALNKRLLNKFLKRLKEYNKARGI